LHPPGKNPGYGPVISMSISLLVYLSVY